MQMHHRHLGHFLLPLWGFPSDSLSEQESAGSAGATEEAGSFPGLERSP